MLAMEKREEKTKCDPCEERFEEHVRDLVNEVKEGHSLREHLRKREEVETAFAPEHKER